MVWRKLADVLVQMQMRKSLSFRFEQLQGKNKEKVISREIKRGWKRMLYIQQQLRKDVGV